MPGIHITFAIQEMRTKPGGFELLFTAPIDAKTLSDAAIALSSDTCQYSSAYGSAEILTKQHGVSDLVVADDGKTVRFRVEDMRALFVHELRTSGIQPASGAKLEFPNAYYTLNRNPK